MEEDWLIDGQILLFDARIVNDQRNAEALLVWIRAYKVDHEGPYLLGFVLGVDGELDVVAFAEMTKLIDILVIASDQRAEFTTRHFQVILRAGEVRSDGVYFAVHALDVIRAGLCGEPGLGGGIHLSNLLLIVGANGLCFIPRLPQLALREAQPLRDHAQVTL